MEWNEFYERYQAFVGAIRQADLVAIVAAKALTDFPNEIPAEWKKGLDEAIAQLRNALDRVIDDTGKGAGRAKSGKGKSGKIAVADDDFVHSTIKLLITTLKKPANFAEIAHSQQMVMAFAHMSAFIADSVRAICLRCPSVLKSSQRQVDWQTLIECGDWNTVVSHLIEDYVFRFGWDSVSKTVQAMREKLGLELKIPEDCLKRVEDAELVRNLIVHNGGRVSKEYLKRSKRTDVEVGQVIPVEKPMISQVRADLLLIASDILLDVSEIHFGKRRSEIIGIWRYKVD